MHWCLHGCPVCWGDLRESLDDAGCWICAMCAREWTKATLAAYQGSVVPVASTDLRCPTCGLTKPSSDFSRVGRNQHGEPRKVICKSCNRSEALSARHAAGWQSPAEKVRPREYQMRKAAS